MGFLLLSLGCLLLDFDLVVLFIICLIVVIEIVCMVFSLLLLICSCFVIC